MNRKLLVALLTGAALSGGHAQAGGAQDDMPRQDSDTQQQQERHVVASPNPTIDDSKSTPVEPDKVTVERVEPTTATTAAPMKKTAKPKRKKRGTQ